MNLVTLIFGICFASPHPGAGTSVLVSPDKALFFARKGFKLNQGQTKWQLIADNSATSDNFLNTANNKAEFKLRFSPPVGGAFLEVATDTLSQETNLETYAKKWVKDYPLYGFEVLGTKPFLQNRTKGFLVDLIHKKMKKQVRQVIFISGKNSVTLTCVDQIESFNSSIQDCNSIIRTFDWAQSATK